MDLLSSQFLAPLHVTEARFHLTAALSNPRPLRSSQWLTRCNFPYGKRCYYHSRQKYQSLYGSQCWNLAVIWIKELAYSASANRERARWTHTRLPWSFPLFIVSSFHSFVLNSSKGRSPRWDQEPSMLWRPLPEGSMGETTSRTAPSVLFALPVQGFEPSNYAGLAGARQACTTGAVSSYKGTALWFAMPFMLYFSQSELRKRHYYHPLTFQRHQNSPWLLQEASKCTRGNINFLLHATLDAQSRHYR